VPGDQWGNGSAAGLSGHGTWEIRSGFSRSSGGNFGAAVVSVQNATYQAGMDARFAAAARHSRLVRVLRIAVPGAVVLALAAIIGISIFNPFRTLMNQLPVDADNLVVSGTKITMESPHLSGFSPDQRPYEVWAKTATQDLLDPDHVDLNTIRAKVLMEDRSTVTMDARQGIFDTKGQVLDLRQDIFLQSSTGYEARLTHAIVDIAKGAVTSDQPVAVKLLNGTLDANGLRIIDKGDVVRFEGNVVMNLVMDTPAPPSQPEAEAEPEASNEEASPPPPTRSVKPHSSRKHGGTK
jgi:lipopolysaccharide export system protein LptC